MKRILFDVPRWQIYLHRRERGMALADLYDQKDRALADEVFGKIFGAAEPLPPDEVKKLDEDLVEWAQRQHAEIEAMPEYAEATRNGRGHAGKAAQATTQLFEKLAEKRQAQMDALDQMAQAMGQAQQSGPSGADQDVADGLSGVKIPGMGWTGQWQGQNTEDQRAKTLAEKLKDNERLKKIAMLAGKFKRIALDKQKRKVRRGADEIADIEQGDRIERLLPTELSRLASGRYKLAAMRDLIERKCLQYQMESVEVLGRGPLILCVDKSPSMEGDKDIWACAVGLALMDIAHRAHRDFILLGFNDEIPQRVVVRRGRPMPENALLFPCSGGTDVTKVLDLALQAVETRDIMKRADIIVVTDGESDTSRAKWIRKRAEAKDVSITGIGIGVKKRTLKPWCGNLVHSVEATSLDEVDDEAATVLFDR